MLPESAMNLSLEMRKVRKSVVDGSNLLLTECVDALGMENGDIKDMQITASSSRTADLPQFGRLNNGKYWCPEKANKKEYLQVDFGQASKTEELNMG